MKKKIIVFTTCVLLFCGVNINAQVTGDVNHDSDINIVDALLTAQYYVGLEPSIAVDLADVDADEDIDIIDALMIAQYYVGLISVFPASLIIPPIEEEYKVIRVPIIDLSMLES